ncbi:MAG: hypothetical protein IPH84_16825 [Bacteroidales bacterium]|nr:hypothetical protein [Bacteroidales bacterium]
MPSPYHRSHTYYSASPDDAFCVLNPITLPELWPPTSHPTNGCRRWYLNNNTLLSPTYMPGNLDFNAGSVTLTFAVQGRLSCSAQTVTDTRVFAVSPFPVVNAGSDNFICSNTTQFTLAGIGNNYDITNIQWTFVGGDGFLSNPNILNPTYFAGPIDLSTVNRTITFTLTLEGNGQCAGTFVNDQVLLQIDPTP